MAVAMAGVGGVGIIHYNNSLEEQLHQVKTAKNHTPGFVVHPVCLPPDAAIAQLADLRERRGHSSVCVTDTGALGGKLLGIVTTRDWDWAADMQAPLSEVMTRDVETAQQGETGGRAGGQGGWGGGQPAVGGVQGTRRCALSPLRRRPLCALQTR